MNLCISLNVHFINDKSLPQELLFARQLRIKGSQYFMLLCSLSNIRKFHLLMYLLEQVMEHDQWLVTISSVLLTWKNSVKYLYQSLSIIASVWLQKTSVLTCTNHYILSLQQWIKLKPMLLIIDYFLLIMMILNGCCFILKFTIYQKVNVWDVFTTFLTPL